MLSEELVNLPPQKKYKKITSDNVFIGCKIKNLYDEKRVEINSRYNPDYYEVDNETLIYGAVYKPTSKHSLLIQNLKNKDTFDVMGYSSLLEKYSLTCDNCFLNLKPPVYPVDMQNVTSYLSEYKYEDFILFKKELPNFQQFISINMFLILPS